jgi:hypothetical protein
MRRTVAAAWLAAAMALASGCATGPLLDNPLLVRPDPAAVVENPVFIPLGPPSYGIVYERVIDVIDDYFEISYTNRYDGTIRTFPRISPGLGQPWKPGPPDCYQRLEATLQTMRRRSDVLIQPADDGGFFVHVTVYRELEDLPRPTRAGAGAATFRSVTDVDRQYEVIDPTVFESKWIPVGRDAALEQVILERLKKCL